MDDLFTHLKDWPVVAQGAFGSLLATLLTYAFVAIVGPQRIWSFTKNLRKSREDVFIDRILEDIDEAGKYVLAALANCPEAANVDFLTDPVPNVHLVSLPKPQLVTGDFDWANPTQIEKEIPIPWIEVNEWVIRLRDRRLIYFHLSLGKGGYGQIYLSELGQKVVRSKLFVKRYLRT